MNNDKKVLPSAEKFASCPYDQEILPYYEGQFDCVYILLHPFCKPTTLDICYRFYAPRDSGSRRPDKHEIIDGCEPVSWQEVLSLSGLESISDIDIGLRTSIGGLVSERENREFSDQLVKLEKLGILLPDEGDLPPLLENRVYEAVKKLGYTWLWVGDEFGTERKLHWIGDLVKTDEIPPHGCIFTHDHKLLVTTHWDSHCSYLCSSREIIEQILESDPFEGFYCTSNTSVFWGLYEI
ncbi:DUF2711 family protein [Enterovibrio nigricans]|uniref:DUF2711 domain-containing protein n=1 Tax=Enterovibrio nigricans DSM 22720 TaxID=1121868 RepID=A0A1T4VYK5_9GAMM|nr:DUF2711 family protein [Enterovibrio nigricans]PKF49200.1 DUF2711 domain-containing protein [Enterovibrio nigricans]SKA70112.1 Protein of unknown function [Enterovibrio nigricans DSM 22720]